MKKISVVTTLYYSASYIEEFYQRMHDALVHLGLEREIILVNDGSPDNSLELSLNIMAKDPYVKVIDLSKNYGHHKAIMTGLAHATGDLVFLIDSDLEEDPELLELFYREMEKYQGNVDVIYGIQEAREGGWFRRWSGEFFYRIFNFLSGEPIPRNLAMTRLMTQRYVRSLVRFQDKNVFIAGLFHLTGFKQVPLTIQKRFKGKSTYNFIRRLGLGIDAITSFSNRPLVLISLTGLLIMIPSFIYISYLIYRKLLTNIPVDGWTSLIVSVWFLGGITIFFIGVIGIYIAKIFLETKKRPYSIVRDIYYGKGLQSGNGK